MLRSYLCDYSDAYIVVRGIIDLLAAAANENDKAGKDVAFKSNAPFRSWIWKVKRRLIDSAEDLGIVMPMHNLLEYSQNYSMSSGSLWDYHRDEIDDVDDNVLDGKSLAYETKIVGKTPKIWSGSEGDENRPPAPNLNVECTIPIKFAIDKLWNRTRFIMDKGTCIDTTS